MKNPLLLFVVTLTAIHPGGDAEQLCTEWTKAAIVGELPPQLRESSGMAASREVADRLYHVNDSGDAGRFFVSGLDGARPQSVAIAGFKPRDAEALSVGPCPGLRRSCLYVGDIGDNNRRRQFIQIVAVEEQPRFESSVKPAAQLTLRYPDGPHNAESMAVHPDGTLFILTKEQPARLFRATLGQEQQTLTAVTTVDAGSPPTDMAISDDGRRWLVLTYKGAFEFTSDFKERRSVLSLVLPQQESATYLRGGRSFVFTTERVFMLQPQPIMRADCQSSH